MIQVSLLLRFVVVVSLLFPGGTHAQSMTQLFDAITALTQWFSKLNAQFDVAVKTEARGQLQRAVDRLRRDLYMLESDARLLVEAIPDKSPSNVQRTRLDELARELQSTVQRLRTTVRSLGAELRLNEAERVEEALNVGLRSRAAGIAEVRNALLPEQGATWNGAQLRAHLQKGIDDIRTAQLAVTSFSKTLSATP